MTTYFFEQPVLQQKNLNDEINIAMKKVTGQLTPGMSANYDESVKRFVSNDQGFFIYEWDKRNPCILQKVSERSFGNGRTIRLPNLFLTLFCANLRSY